MYRYREMWREREREMHRDRDRVREIIEVGLEDA